MNPLLGKQQFSSEDDSHKIHNTLKMSYCNADHELLSFELLLVFI